MLKEAVVLKIINSRIAEISVIRESACGKNCISCGGCGGKTSVITARAVNTCGANVGDRVNVEADTRSILGIAVLVYILPLLLFFTGYFLTHSFLDLEWARVLTGIAGFAAGFVISRQINKRIRDKGGVEFRIISVN